MMNRPTYIPTQMILVDGHFSPVLLPSAQMAKQSGTHISSNIEDLGGTCGCGIYMMGVTVKTKEASYVHTKSEGLHKEERARGRDVNEAPSEVY